MSKKGFNILAIVVGVLAAWVISGCTNKPATIVTSTDQSITIQLNHPYPQMYTPEMLENMDAIEKKHNITWIGCYDDTLGSFILWFIDNRTGECGASVIVPPDIHSETCEFGWDLYLEVCERLGNCQQLI